MSQLPNFTLPLPSVPALPADTLLAHPKEEIGLGTAIVRRGASQLANLIETGRSASTPIDPSFAWTEESLKQYTNGIDSDLIDAFGRAKSLDDANEIRLFVMEKQLARNRLRDAGAPAHVAEIGVSLIDPVNVAIMLGTGGLGTAAKVGGAGARLAAMAENGLIAGGINAGTATAFSMVDPEINRDAVVHAGLSGFGFGAGAAGGAGKSLASRVAIGAGSAAAPGVVYDTLTGRQWDDIAYAGLEAAIMGGVFSIPHAGPVAKQMNEELRPAIMGQMDDIQFKDLKQLATESGKTIYEVMSPEAQAKYDAQIKALHEEAAAAKANGQLLDTSKPFEGVAMGAASPAEFQLRQEAIDAKLAANNGKTNTDFWVREISDSPASQRAGRVSMVAYVSDSPSALVRQTANAVFTDYLPKENGSGGAFTMTKVEANKANLAAKANIEAGLAYEAHRKYAIEHKQQPLSPEKFRASVTQAARRDPSLVTDPGIKMAIAHDDAAYSLSARMRQRHNVPGWDAFPIENGYRPIIYDPEAVAHAVWQYGETSVIRTVSNAIKARSQTISAKMADDIAAAVVRRQTSKLFANERYDTSLFHGNPEDLAQAIRDHVPGATEAQIEDVLYEAQVKQAGGEKKAPSPRARRRIDMDHSLEEPVFNQQTGTTDKLSVDMLTVQDSLALRIAYEAQGVHEAALNTVFQSLAREGEKPATTVQEFMTRLRDIESASVGITDKSARANFNTDLERLEVGLNAIAGRSLSKSPRLASAVRTVNEINGIRMLSDVATGIRNLSDMGSPIAHAGAKITLEAVPDLLNIARYFRNAETGRVNSDLLRQLEIMGLGIHRAARSKLKRTSMIDGEPVATNGFQSFLEGANHFSQDYSLQSAGTRWMELSTGDLLVQEWAQRAFRGKPLSKTMLQTLNIDEAMEGRIAAGLKDPTVTKTRQGWLGSTKIHDLDMAAFTKLDPEAANQFTLAIVAEARRLIQVNDPTQYTMWMHSELGKVMTHLKRYNTVAYEGKLLRKGSEWKNGEYGLVMGSLITSTAASVMTYIVSNYYASIGRQDRDEFLSKRMNPLAIAKNSVGRADFSSFMPEVVDTVAGRTRMGYVFADSTISGRSRDFLNPNNVPAMDLYNSMNQGSYLPLGWMGRGYTREDFHTGARILPNLLKLRDAVEWWGSRYPSGDELRSGKGRP